ncbi:GNAT family N-acetyltransferase [Desulfosporosinus meridiei]|uniref:Acetyltransferase (GNAT) family protein n=1 Tax=Desulfosporosinus meridiei (strain ATCC BAA-275 / DSM 13257 / KCTC 12902 / NCIMB 13706 / S10) TaxID=768704 RepID=J7ITQ9_DESMD|nr:GNAT family N-acetyltransferase [Desulfosporosinus meridiei]AFQ43549.1 acetyltransferase (GNAT) family protein [Desulfosporosinus meridiei DSM 13257]
MSLVDSEKNKNGFNYISNTFSNNFFCTSPKDTGIFVYKPLITKARNQNMVLFYQNVLSWVEMLRDSLVLTHSLKFETITCETDSVSFDNLSEKDNTQLWLHFCNAKQGIYVDRLSLPLHFRRMGIGTICINWLKDLVSELGFKYIILGSVVEAREFWIKMGFTLLSTKELDDFPGYQGRYTR